jgi:DNA replication licensing factor MCM6
MVREAYSLLRQSIIHVEQDDINFDDDEEQNGPSHGFGSNRSGTRTTQDQESQDAADIAAMEAAESSYNANATSSAAGQENGGDGSIPVPKRKMQITCMSTCRFDRDSV